MKQLPKKKKAVYKQDTHEPIVKSEKMTLKKAVKLKSDRN